MAVLQVHAFYIISWQKLKNPKILQIKFAEKAKEISNESNERPSVEIHV